MKILTESNQTIKTIDDLLKELESLKKKSLNFSYVSMESHGSRFKMGFETAKGELLFKKTGMTSSSVTVIGEEFGYIESAVPFVWHDKEKLLEIRSKDAIFRFRLTTELVPF